ncbi:hypothetical protein JW948_07730 [bacterium]|nr:hypothetical protein [bacterium]
MHLWKTISTGLMILCILAGAASIVIRDADKSPLYFLLAVVFWRLREPDSSRS